MSSREIALWVDERWYQALSLHLKNETVEDKLNNYLDELISQLPDHTREKISREIWEEDQQREQEIRASRRYSAFRIMENGVTQYFQMDRSVWMLEIAGYIRLRLRQQGEPRSLAESLRGREEISAEEFEWMLSSCMEEGGKVTDGCGSRQAGTLRRSPQPWLGVLQAEGCVHSSLACGSLRQL